MKNNIILIGMMGSGKSTCGALLAKRLGRQFLDTDRHIEQSEGMSISEIFSSLGEGRFRELELRLAEEISQLGGLVVSTGGGMLMQPSAAEALGKNGIFIYLNMPLELILKNLSREGRPLARSGDRDFAELYKSRQPVYERYADIVASDFRDAGATVANILKKLEGVQ